MNYTYKTSGTCSTSINFDIDGDVISNVSFTGGCNGNLKAISILVNNMKVSEIEEKLGGNTCGFRKTSCADQLAKAVRQAYNEQNQ